MIRTAFLPAAGLGTRLRPLTDTTPKPLLRVKGEPLIVHAMRHCAAAGIERFLVNTHHLPEAFSEVFPGSTWQGLPVRLVHEPVRLETGTGLRNTLETSGVTEPVLVYNADILTDFPLRDLLREHTSRPSASTLAVAPNGPQMHVVTDAAGNVTAIDRDTEAARALRFQYLGVCVVEPSLVGYLDRNRPESLVAGWLRAIGAEPGSVRVHPVTGGRWIDAGTPALYRSVSTLGLEAPETVDLGRKNEQ